ncbi:MAG: hypothetical protein KDK30_03650 [Leptospiraceae bacterium]|nr:hypothetical protein [Leptospiraceae bacterium]MCB1314345.1 hypothetical protein [Leptospiraceae bacterium]
MFDKRFISGIIHYALLSGLVLMLAACSDVPDTSDIPAATDKTEMHGYRLGMSVADLQGREHPGRLKELRASVPAWQDFTPIYELNVNRAGQVSYYNSFFYNNQHEPRGSYTFFFRNDRLVRILVYAEADQSLLDGRKQPPQLTAAGEHLQAALQAYYGTPQSTSLESGELELIWEDAQTRITASISPDQSADVDLMPALNLELELRDGGSIGE